MKGKIIHISSILVVVGISLMMIIPSGLISPTKASSPWPTFRGNPQRTGLSCYNSSNNDGELLWKFHATTDIFASPTIAADGTIYIGTVESDTNTNDSYMFAIAHNGTVKWKFKPDRSSISSSVALDKDENLYFGTYYGSLSNPLDPHGMYSLSPNGTLRWKYQTQGDIEASPVVNNNTVYFGSEDGYLYSMGLDGTFNWKFHTGGSFGSSPTLGYDGTIYAAKGNNMYAINPNGTLQWKIYLPTYLSTPVVSTNWDIYVASNSNLTALDRFGRILWNFSLGFIQGGMSITSPAIGRDGTLYIYSQAPHEQIFAIDPDGTLKWNSSTLSSASPMDGWSPAVSSDNTIYIERGRGILALNPHGTIKWDKFYAGSNWETSPAIGQDGTVYFVSGTNDLLALGNKTALPQMPSDCYPTPSSPPQDNAPVFLSHPDSTPHDFKVAPGKKVNINIFGNDPDYQDEGRLRYSLIKAPEGTTIDQWTFICPAYMDCLDASYEGANINWSPKAKDLGKHTIIVSLTDGIKNVTTSFNITVQEPVSGVFVNNMGQGQILIWVFSAFMVVLGMAFVGGTEVGVFGMYSFVLLMYTRIKGEKILDNFVRGQLYGIILQWPGSSFSDLKRTLDKPNGTVVYHLKALEREGMIKCVSRYGKKLFFPSSFIVTDDYFALTDAQRAVYNIVKAYPGISQRRIAKRTGFKTPRVNKIIQKLSQRGMLEVVKGKPYVQGDQVLKDDSSVRVSS